jgi:CHAT domain-containing protein
MADRSASFQSLARELYRRAVQPLLPVLGPRHRLLLAPDGQLSLVPFDVLHDGGQFLIDTHDITYLTSGKDLLPRVDGPQGADAVVVLADPDFTAPARALPAPEPVTPGMAERSPELEHFFSTLSRDVAAYAVPLPGTRREAEAIQRLLPRARVFLGAEATKERLLGLPTPGILHLATHGFLLGDLSTATDARAVAQFGTLGEAAVPPRASDPLLRSGLLLAGASTQAASPDSALVTALELAGLNLWGTQLVVLSACDTGRGDIKLGQGVYGLRRAFVVAGAETVVMSLWKVNDETTRELMEAYYRNLLAGQGRGTALREAMRWLRSTRPHPHHWAPFIALGQDTPLHPPSPAP